MLCALFLFIPSIAGNPSWMLRFAQHDRSGLWMLHCVQHDKVVLFRMLFCHSEHFSLCHSERSEESMTLFVMARVDALLRSVQHDSGVCHSEPFLVIPSVARNPLLTRNSLDLTLFRLPPKRPSPCEGEGCRRATG